ncbi:hypothetical protein A8990_102141 [Paenibacillus taihuensis]|uniref:Uncharacterized protein n=1 Tax=Paenibacillus taihuensis TaxID=1156355 RepID=A0A3D9SMC3_9BACL|nr:hypothetical protein [Paenibacillus taihuensis]REE93055.1 hypothetical protein A8990_102141 [Paenibacillus taihuensis]
MEKKVTTSPVGKVPNQPIMSKSKGSKGSKGETKHVTKQDNKPMVMESHEKHEKHEKHAHHHHHDMKKKCHEHMHRYVLVQTHDGWCCDGIVEHIDDEYVCLAVPCGGDIEQRAFFPQPPFFPIYPYPFFPRRRFVRQVFPLSTLLTLSLLPFY